MDDSTIDETLADPEPRPHLSPRNLRSTPARAPVVRRQRGPRWEQTERTTFQSQPRSEILKYGFALAIIGFVLNVLGNLLASGIQQSLLQNIFAPLTIVLILFLAWIGVIIRQRMRQRQSIIRSNWEAALIFGVIGLLSGAILAIASPVFITQSTPLEPRFIRPIELKRLFDGIETRPVIVDVRKREEYDEEHIASAISIPAGDIFADHDPSRFQFPKDKLIILYCN